MNANELEDAVTELESLVKRADVKTEPGRNELLMRARNLSAILLDPYTLFHTKIVVNLVKKRGGDKIDEVAAWLHDIGRAVVDSGHREVGAIWAEKWLKKFYITDEEIERILDGIRNHGVTDDPKTKTGKLLKLIDALAVFDEGWVAIVTRYSEISGNSAMLKQFQEKAKVIREIGNDEDVERMKTVAERYGIEV